MPTPNQKQLAEQLIAQCEGLILTAERDKFGVINIGYGNARFYPNGNPIKVGDTCTKEEAIDYMRQHLEKNVYRVVDSMCQGYNVSDRVYAGLCSFLYNGGNAGYSIVKALHDRDLNALYEGFRLYNKVTINGVKIFVKGLANRREIEINFMEGS